MDTDSLATTLTNVFYKERATVGQIVETQMVRLSANAKAALRPMDSIARMKALKKALIIQKLQLCQILT